MALALAATSVVLADTTALDVCVARHGGADARTTALAVIQVAAVPTASRR